MVLTTLKYRWLWFLAKYLINNIIKIIISLVLIMKNIINLIISLYLSFLDNKVFLFLCKINNSNFFIEILIRFILLK